jgi:hypothetical protein
MDYREFFSQVYGFILWLLSFWQVKFLLAHIALNVVVAMAASIYVGEFLLGKVGQFLYRKVLPYLLIFGAFAAMGKAANLGAITNGAFAALEAMLLADLLDNLHRMGLKIPQALRK